MPELPRLFSPVTLGAVSLANRVVMAPMTRSRARPDGTPQPLNATYYQQRAGAGLLITEATAISVQGTGYPLIPGMYTEAHAAGWRLVVDAVHAAGSRIALQLFHVGRLVLPDFQPDGAAPVSASAVRAETMQMMTPQFTRKPAVTPRALAVEDLPGIVAQFAQAARFAAAAGFDAVELHGANGYLLDQFLRDGVNHRSDAYGGTPARRARLLLEVVEAVAREVGADRTGVRLSPHAAIHDMSDSAPRRTFTAVAKALAPLGLAWLHVTEMAPPGAAQAARDTTHSMRDAYQRPLLLNGGFDAERAEAVLAEDVACAVSFGTLFIANPDLPARFRAGAPLTPPDPATFYGGDARGYTDYPTLATG